MAELRLRRAQLLVETTEDWPEAKEINQQIAALEKEIKSTRNRATSTVTTNLETRYRQAVAREQTLRAAFNQQRSETLAQNQAAIGYRIIQQEIETNRTLLNGLLQGAKENDVVWAGTPNNIHVLNYAIPPALPIGPNRTRGAALALALSLALGIALALFMEYMNDTVRSADDVERMLQLPALAVIPEVGDLTRHRHLLPAMGALQKRVETRGQELLINAEARAPLAEAYRQLRTSVLLSTPGRPPKTLLVTSSQPGEGKTTTAVNTAMVLSQTNAKVLIG